jgi:hypothetical protein
MRETFTLLFVASIGNYFDMAMAWNGWEGIFYISGTCLAFYEFVSIKRKKNKN